MPSGCSKTLHFHFWCSKILGICVGFIPIASFLEQTKMTRLDFFVVFACIGLCHGGCSATKCLVHGSWLLALRVAVIGQNLSKLPFPERAEALSIALQSFFPLCLNIFLRTSTNSEVKEQPRAVSSMQEQLTKNSMPSRFKL